MAGQFATEQGSTILARRETPGQTVSKFPAQAIATNNV